MNYAIIEFEDLLEVIKLGDWEDYEWGDFNTVRSKESDEIKWFYEEQQAINFMKNHFLEEKINPKYARYEDITKEYYIG